MLLQINTATKCDCAPLSPVASRHGPVTVTSPRVQTAWGLSLAVFRVRFEGGSVRRLRRVMCRPPHDFPGHDFPLESKKSRRIPLTGSRPAHHSLLNRTDHGSKFNPYTQRPSPGHLVNSPASP